MAKKKVWVVGHKHPDTDSICAAISYANLKNEIEKKESQNSYGNDLYCKESRICKCGDGVCSGKVSCRGPGNDFGCRNTDQGYSDTPYRGSKQSYLYEKGMGDDEDPRGCYTSGGAGK